MAIKVDQNAPMENINTTGFSYIPAKMNFAGRNFIDNIVLSKDLMHEVKSKNIIETKSVRILSYFNENKLSLNFRYEKNGFEYVEFGGGFLTNIRKYANDPNAIDFNLPISICSFMHRWGEAKGFKFDDVVFLESVYRNQDELDENSDRPIHFAHVDFQRESIKKTFESHKNSWRAGMSLLLGDKINVTENVYSNLKVMEMCNLWLSLNSHLTKSTLALMDISSLNLNELLPFTNEAQAANRIGEFTSMSIAGNDNQRWVANPQMKIGGGYIFNSLMTPHSAVDLLKNPDVQYDAFRKSVEVRCAFIKYGQC